MKSSAEVRKISRYLKKAEAEINKLEIWPRIANRYPFDIVALAIVSKVFALAKGCLQLLNSGLPDEAFGLSRSICRMFHEPALLNG